MPIKHLTHGGTSITGDSIDFFRLCTLRGAVGLELKGMKMTRGPVVWKRVKAEFGLKGNKQAVYDWLCAEVERQKAMQEHQTEAGGRLIREVGGQEVQ
jgi:hypothetical protein